MAAVSYYHSFRVAQQYLHFTRTLRLARHAVDKAVAESKTGSTHLGGLSVSVFWFSKWCWLAYLVTDCLCLFVCLSVSTGVHPAADCVNVCGRVALVVSRRTVRLFVHLSVCRVSLFCTSHVC